VECAFKNKDGKVEAVAWKMVFIPGREWQKPLAECLAGDERDAL